MAFEDITEYAIKVSTCMEHKEQILRPDYDFIIRLKYHIA